MDPRTGTDQGPGIELRGPGYEPRCSKIDMRNPEIEFREPRIDLRRPDVERFGSGMDVIESVRRRSQATRVVMMHRQQVTLKANMSGMFSSDDFPCFRSNSTATEEIDEFADNASSPATGNRSHDGQYSSRRREECHASIPSNCALIFDGHFKPVPQRRRQRVLQDSDRVYRQDCWFLYHDVTSDSAQRCSGSSGAVMALSRETCRRSVHDQAVLGR